MARVPARSSVSSFGRGLFGGRVPAVIGVLIVATFVLSIVGAVGLRHGFPIARWSALVAERVLHLELWRLFSWVFFEITTPWGLLFACLALYWFGADLAIRWGTHRFVAYYLGLAAAIGIVVTAIGRVYPPIAGYTYLGATPVTAALVIFWAAYFPAKQLRIYFVVPLGGRRLIYATLAITVLFALFFGIEPFIPEFVAEGLALAIAFLPSPREWWLERKLRGMEQRRQKSHLRVVPRDADLGDDDKPEPPGGRWLN